jgi:type IV fimbrial biogenesis protein FimT
VCLAQGSNIKNGFTLVELIVTTSVLAIIVTLALPSLLQQFAKMEAKRIRFDLTTTLSQAKAESYISRRNLIVCLSDSAGRCDKNGKQKILLFMDDNVNNHYDAGTDELLNEQSLNPRYGKLQLRASAGRHHIKFFGDSGKPRGHFGHIK